MTTQPLRSMTGFGAAEVVGAGVIARVEVRTVNHRHLLVKVRAPYEFSGLEGEIEALAKRALGRGSVNLAVQVERESGNAAAQVDTAVAREYAAAFESLARDIGLAGGLSIDALAGLPGVIAQRSAGDPSDAEGKIVLDAVSAALEALLVMREREGATIFADLQASAAAIDAERAWIAERSPVVVSATRDKYTARVNELLGGATNVSSTDLAREIAILADRLDVSEELQRLEAHVGQLNALLEGGGAIGRKLDFLAQEFFREANTIGSKCSDAATAHRVVELKTWIERLREQVQNVE